MEKYNHKKIESKWQKKWVKDKTFTPDLKKAENPYYALFMFPYPSAEGLHIGNFYAFTCVDVMAKYKKLQGKDVFEPIGFDAFGMHSENYALKIGETPKKMLNRTMANFRKQLSSAGLGCDWTREIDTTAPEYYKWTQWMFTKLFEKGLAYQKQALLNWCPSCKTVLADEQIENGVCERCKSVPEKKTMKQWFLKITAYAQRLLDGLDDMDWSDITKNAQRNWIGRSEGASVKFQISNHKLSPPQRDPAAAGQTNSKSQIPKYDKILLATNNNSKRKRVKRLLKSMGMNIKVLAPEDLKIERADIAEDGDLFENAKNKALAYRDKTDLPILGTDTGFYIKDERVDPVKVRRNALKGENEKDLSQEQIAKKMIDYYKEIACKNDGQVDAYWKDCFVLSLPDGSIKKSESKREVILTDQISGEIDIYVPIRCLYKPKATGKYVSEQNQDEELKELKPIINSLAQLLCADNNEVEVFTTRPDTLFGATYMVLSPEHPLVNKIVTEKQKKEVEKYIKGSGAKSDLERAEAKEKTGVFTGAYVINPVNNEKIPVWIADYVLMGYGTGAIMAVPAHDERDFEFAKKYNLPIKEVVIPIFGNEHKNEKYRETITALVYRKKDNKFLYLNDNHYKIITPIIGGIKKHESIKDTAKREIHEETGYKVKSVKKLGSQVESHFFASHKNVWRYRLDQPVLCELLDEDAEPDEISEEEKNKHKIAWLTAQEALKRIAHEDNKIGLLRYLGEHGVFCGDGRSVDSKFISGLKTQEAKKAIIKWLEERKLGERTVNYKLRDWCISRQRYWGPPVPIVYCGKCGSVAVPEKDLPVKLPEIEKGWEPAGDGRGPLAKIDKFMKIFCPKCGGPAEREPDVMDNFLDSAWYFFRYISPHDDKNIFDKKLSKRWLPVDFYVGGNEHAVLHLMYTRFITMALHDLGLIDFDNPFKKFRANGMILKDGKKMSKSKGNIVHPEEYGEKIGYDALKIYLLFLGPLSEDRSFSDAGALGAKRWVERIARLKEKVNNNCEDSVNTIKKLHQTIKIVTSDFESQKYNTAIARLMELTNTLSAEKNISSKTWEKFLILTAPFAPALAEELWSSFARATEDKEAKKKYKQSVFKQSWPKYNKELVKDEIINLVVQVNGKLRDTIEVDADISEDEAKKVAMESEKINKWVKGKKVVKVIFVKGKLVNIVIK